MSKAIFEACCFLDCLPCDLGKEPPNVQWLLCKSGRMSRQNQGLRGVTGLLESWASAVGRAASASEAPSDPG